jgi:hypothetical protein
MREKMIKETNRVEYNARIKPHEDAIAFRLKDELERKGVPLRMSMDDFNNEVKREDAMRVAVLQDREWWSPEDDGDVSNFLWVAMNNGNRKARWVDIAISSWTSSPRK